MNQILKKNQPDRKGEKSTYKFSNDIEFNLQSDEFHLIALYAFNNGISMSEAANRISRLALESESLIKPYEATHKACKDQIRRAINLILNGHTTEAQKVLHAVVGAMADMEGGE